MQAFALTVLSFDGDQAEQLYAALQAQGHAVTLGSVFASDPTPAPADAEPTPEPAPVVEAEPETADSVAGGTADNGLPFKCPACGRTYPTATVCAVEHPAEATLPTQDVLDGAPTGQSLEDAPKAAADAVAADPAAPAAAAAPPADENAVPPAGPTWPAE